MTTTEPASWGELDGETITGGLLKVSGTRTAERIIKEGETVFLLVEAKGGTWTKVSRDAHGSLVREMSLVVDEMTEVPDELRTEVAEVLKQVADDRAGRQVLPGMADDPENESDPDDGPTPLAVVD